jgi:hypothetical protein
MMIDEALNLWWDPDTRPRQIPRLPSAHRPYPRAIHPPSPSPSARQIIHSMRDPLLPAENDNGSSPTLTLRETTLDLRTVLAELLTFGPAAASRWGMAAPPLTSQELDLIRETAMRDGAARDMLSEAGWAGALERRPTARPAEAAQEELTAAQRAWFLLGGGAMAVGITLWAHLG